MQSYAEETKNKRPEFESCCQRMPSRISQRTNTDKSRSVKSTPDGRRNNILSEAVNRFGA